ncbi:hypothetical protein ACOMHN_051838 [Nucella lapillus]
MKPKGLQSAEKYTPLSYQDEVQNQENRAMKDGVDIDPAVLLPPSEDTLCQPEGYRKKAIRVSFLLLICLITLVFTLVYGQLNTVFSATNEVAENSACGKVSASGDFVDSQPSPVKCMDECTFSLVESIPQGLTYEPGKVVHPSTYSGLKMLLASAKKSIRIASFYWTLRGTDISFHDDTAKEGEDIFNTLLQVSKGDNVSLQIAQNAVNSDTDLLAKGGHAEVRTLNFTRLMGAGVLHTKFWLVDDQHFYIGSANLDWRSLTQVKELGIVVQNCPCLAQDLLKVFQVYWYLGTPDHSVPANWPPQYNTSINARTPATVHFNRTEAPVYMSSSPPPFCPRGRTVDVDAIVRVIQEAEHFVYIAVMDYSPTTLYNHPNTYWPVIDDALRHAAFDRRVSVRLLASRWKHTKKDMYAFLCSLQMMVHVRYPRVSVQVKLFEVPTYTKNQSQIPFSRVNHNKYMVTDQHAYIGTSNWSADYFINTGGVGFVVKQPQDTMNSTQGDLRGQLYDVFNRDWYSNYSSDLYCNFNTSKSMTLEL